MSSFWDDIEILKTLDRLEVEAEVEGRHSDVDGLKLIRAITGERPVTDEECAAFDRRLGLLKAHHRLSFATSHDPYGREQTKLDALRSLFNIHLTETGRDRARGRIVYEGLPNPDEDDGRPIPGLILQRCADFIAGHYTDEEFRLFLRDSELDRMPTSPVDSSTSDDFYKILAAHAQGTSEDRGRLRKFLARYINGSLDALPTMAQWDVLKTGLAKAGWHIRGDTLVIGERLVTIDHAVTDEPQSAAPSAVDAQAESDIPTPEFLTSELVAWGREHREVLERIVDELRATGTWPSPSELTRQLVRENRPIAVKSLTFGMPRALGFVETYPERVVLLLFALRMTRAGQPLLAGFYEALSLARARYAAEGSAPTLSRSDLADLVREEHELVALSDILLREAPFFGSGYGAATDDWQREVTEDIVRYWDASDIEEYLQTRAQELRISVPPELSAGRIDTETPPAAATAVDAQGTHDVFICHATEDKNTVARPLASALLEFGYSVWLDESELVVGESLTEAIEHGLSHCDFGVVILSQAFFEKRWTKRELAGMTSREVIDGQRMILPVWHGIDSAFLVQRAPMLADLLAARTEDGLDHVAAQIARAIQKRRH